MRACELAAHMGAAASAAFSATCQTAGKATMAAAIDVATTVSATCRSAGKAASDFFDNAKKAAADATSALPAACESAGKAAMAAAAELLEKARKASKAIKKASAAIFSTSVRKALARGFRFLERMLGIEIPFWARVAIAVGAVAVAVGLFIAALFTAAGAAGAGAMMIAPGGGGLMMLRWAFVANPGLYFWLLHAVGPAAAVAVATLSAVLPMVLAFCLFLAVFCISV